jgi:ferrochelatase
MRIDTIIELLDGELRNRGFISEIIGFADKLNQVTREFLFISNDENEIKEAIQNGAYAILSSENVKIIDNEIAWIRVENIEESLLKLLKYKLLNKTLFVTDKITFSIIKSFNKDKKIAFLDEMKVKYLNGDYIYLTSNETIKKLSATKIELENRVMVELVDATLLVSQIKFKNQYYSIRFPAVYKDELEKALYFLEQQNLEYLIKDIELERFYAQFINSRFEKVKFGKTDKVVIFGLKTDNYLMRELNFIFEMGKYGKVRFFDKNNIEQFYTENYNFAVLIDTDIELKEKQIIEKNLLN